MVEGKFKRNLQIIAGDSPRRTGRNRGLTDQSHDKSGHSRKNSGTIMRSRQAYRSRTMLQNIRGQTMQNPCKTGVASVSRGRLELPPYPT
ncbi:hypothetical protein AcW1_007378 [Taiwanofungus camphoratus]|nr:hypothetical protein AcW1_007378 [Antrodia cinnamomea]